MTLRADRGLSMISSLAGFEARYARTSASGMCCARPLPPVPELGRQRVQGWEAIRGLSLRACTTPERSLSLARSQLQPRGPCRGRPRAERPRLLTS